jgi:PleD family two-component response regulator
MLLLDTKTRIDFSGRSPDSAGPDLRHSDFWTVEPSTTPVEGPIRVLIVDDHAIVRHGVRAYLAEDSGLLVVGDAEDGCDAVRQVRELRPDVVLMDLRMPRLDGIAATAMIRRETPTTEVVRSVGDAGGVVGSQRGASWRDWVPWEEFE